MTYGKFLVMAALLGACQTSPSAQVQIDTLALRRALPSFALDPNALRAATLAIVCADGTHSAATPVSVTDTSIDFSAVKACGQAHLVLTVNVASVTAYVGTADIDLVTGLVAVAFVGPLYGELELSAGSGSFSCSVGTQTVQVGATALILPLPVASYPLTCQPAQDGVGSVTISAATRTMITLAQQTAALSALTIAPGSIAFDPLVTSYAVTVPNDTTNLAINATPTSSLATVSIAGVVGTSQTLPFSGATLTIDVAVVDGAATEDYLVTVTRSLLDGDASLSALSLTPGTLAPVFSSPALAYTCSVPEAATVVQLNGTGSALSTVTLLIDGQVAAPSQNANGFVFSPTLDTGQTTVFTLHILAQDGISTSDYVITVSRAVPTNIATLSALSISPGSLSPAFLTTTMSYTVVLASQRTQMNVTVEPTDVNASFTVAGAGGVAGLPSVVALSAGSNSIAIVVTSADQSSQLTYSLHVQVGLISNLNVTGLSGTMVPPFAASQYRYDYDVSGSLPTAIQVNPTPATGSVQFSYTLNGANNGSGSFQALTAGVYLMLVSATAPAGEAEAYLVQAVVNAPQKAFAALITSNNSLQLQEITSGSAAAISGTPGTISQPLAVAVEPRGQYVYLSSGANLGQLAWFEVNSSLSYASQSFTTTASPLGVLATNASLPGAIAVDPAGRFVYAIVGGNSVHTYPITASNGTLQNAGLVNVANTNLLAVDPSASFVYVGSSSTGTTIYSVASNGALTATDNVTNIPTSLAVDGVVPPRSNAFFYATAANDFHFVTVGPTGKVIADTVSANLANTVIALAAGIGPNLGNGWLIEGEATAIHSYDVATLSTSESTTATIGSLTALVGLAAWSQGGASYVASVDGTDGLQGYTLSNLGALSAVGHANTAVGAKAFDVFDAY